MLLSILALLRSPIPTRMLSEDSECSELYQCMKLTGLESIDYKIDPSTATVVVYEKVSETKELTYDVLHKDSLDKKLYIDNVELEDIDIDK